MSAPAVKPALPAPSGAQAPRVGSGAPPNAPSNTPPSAATGAPKLSPNPSGVSPIKPPVPPNTNHAVPSAVPLSLVQEHKVQGNAHSPQPTVGLQRTPEKPKELPPVMSSPQGAKPTSNGVEGSPGKVSHPPVPLLATNVDKKTTEDAVGAAIAMLNHSTEAGLPPTGSGPTPAPTNTATSNVSALPTLPVPQQPPAPVSSNASTPASSHPPAPPTQQSPMKPEPLPTPAAPVAATAPAAPTAAASPAASPPKVSTPPAATSSPAKPDNPVAPAVESKPPAAAPAPATAAAAADTPSSNQPTAAPASGPGPGATGATPTPESPAKPTPPAPPEVTKTRIEISKPEFKVATPRVSKRKRETKPTVEVKSSGDPNDDRKSKRVRTRTQPYQSPLPELTYIVKIKNMIKNKMKDSKSTDDKLIVFYKNEFLAVRNAEGSFYVCQAMQNIYKSSTRIRIRWLSQDKKDNKATDVYIPDFYDVTEFDCILTNLELKKLDKNKFQLPQEEMDRTQSILKRALDVEKGVAEKPPITEEHPDGLDLSLYRDEAQLKKKKQRNSQKASKRAHKKSENDEDENEDGENDESDESQGDVDAEETEEDGEKKKKSSKTPKTKANKKEKSTKKEKKASREKEAASPKKERTSERGRDATKRRAEAASKSTVAKPPPEKKAKVVTSPKPTRKAEKPEAAAESSVPTRATKSRSAKTTVSQSSSKTSPATRIKERERRTVSAAARKKPGKKA